MAASKLSPQERLNRKRNAARLRQQRCRARKRQSVVARRAAAVRPTPAPKTPPPMEAPTSPPKSSLPPRKLWKNRDMGPFVPKLDFTISSDADSIHLRPRTVSFDSESISRSQACSFESLSSSDESDCDRHSPVPAPIKFNRKLPNGEEAAVAAMLSLKTVPERQAIFRPVPTIIRAPVVYPNRWNPMVFQARRPRIMPMMYTNHMA